jgi:hypothetical protein
MKTILCPIDNTAASDHLSKFAAQMAHDNQSKLVLVATHMQSKVPATSGGYEREYGFDRLGELHDLLKDTYHIPCGIDEQEVTGSIYKRLSSVADQYDLMMMTMKPGTPKKTFDLNKLLQETLIPVYVVPERFGYNKINRVLYLYEHKFEPEPPIMTINWLAEWFDASVKFISFQQSNSSYKEKDKLTHQQQYIEHLWQSTRELDFETIVHDDVPRFLEHYVDYWSKNDLLVISINHQKFFEKLWHKGIVKRLLKYASNPFMVIHK